MADAHACRQPATCAAPAEPVASTARRTGLLAALATGLLVVPLLAARAIDPSIASQPGGCFFLRLTGLPCPACGATRAFVLMAHGDGAGALHFNWAWIVIWTVAVFAVGAVAWRSARGRSLLPERLRRAGRWLQLHPLAVATLPFALLAGPWAVAMVNLGAIR